MNDLSLRQRILDELEFEPSVDAANIGVAAHDGIVTLSGHVKSYAEKLAAEQAVQNVRGVRAIAQEIEVRFPEDRKTADDEIARRALDIIDWDTTIPSEKVQVKVHKGWITLTGEAEWQYQKSAAENAVRKLSGVTGVTNLITIKPRADILSIKSRIEDALKRNAEVDDERIRVFISDAKVTIEGTVRDWHERNVAERIAWATPGVTVVANHLTIG